MMSDDFDDDKAGKDNPEDIAHFPRELAPPEPIDDPGLPAHRPRPTDVDPAQEKRAERQVATMFGLATVLVILSCVAYFAVEPDATILGIGAHNAALGTSLGLGLLLIGLGAVQWAKKLMSDHEIIEYRHTAASKEKDREESLAAFNVGVEESGFGRRTMIRNSLLGALGALGLPAIVFLRDLGPLPGNKPAETVWSEGVRVVHDVSGAPLKPEDIEIGQLVNAEPSVFFPTVNENGDVEEAEYHGTELLNAKAKAAVILVRMHPDVITPEPDRENWGVNGILCYSKICTHVGCPISLWEQQTHQVLCPCHQSTFDLADNGKVLFGPAARPLPQLPIAVDDEGYLIAQSDFHEPVGPSYWERG
jgi:ubiquinol-cytochrome c reductase iron-sulfur subunit